jgi:hypothetical protein
MLPPPLTLIKNIRWLIQGVKGMLSPGNNYEFTEKVFFPWESVRELGNLMRISKSPSTLVAHTPSLDIKRNLFLASKSLHASLSGKFQIDLPDQEITCTFMRNNRECLGVSCPFFPKKKQ